MECECFVRELAKDLARAKQICLHQCNKLLSAVGIYHPKFIIIVLLYISFSSYGHFFPPPRSRVFKQGFVTIFCETSQSPFKLGIYSSLTIMIIIFFQNKLLSLILNKREQEDRFEFKIKRQISIRHNLCS